MAVSRAILAAHSKDERGTDIFPNEGVDNRSTQLPAAPPTVFFSFKKFHVPFFRLFNECLVSVNVAAGYASFRLLAKAQKFSQINALS